MWSKLIFLTFLLPLAQTVKVVIFVPTLSNSQLILNYRIGDLLAQAGHDVTMFRPQYNADALKGSSNLTKEIRIPVYHDPKLYRELQSELGAVFGRAYHKIGLSKTYCITYKAV